MEIKNGFVRDVQGSWTNLNHIISFYIEKYHAKDEKWKWAICICLVGDHSIEPIAEQGIDSEEEAQAILDIHIRANRKALL